MIDNSSNTFIDALVFLKYRVSGSSPTTPKAVNVWLFGTADGGTTYTENAGASDAAITLTSPPNALWLGSLNCPTASTSYYGGPWSVKSAFGGSMPQLWGIIVENQTGVAADSTGGNFAAFYQGVYNQYT